MKKFLYFFYREDSHFPLKKWRQISNGILEQNTCYTYGESFGEGVLKQELSLYLLQARGVSIDFGTHYYREQYTVTAFTIRPYRFYKGGN